jgi:hypothetical protein
LSGNHECNTLVDRTGSAEAFCESRQHLGELPSSASDGHLVALRKVDHDVGDVPAFTSGGCLPLSFGEGFQMTLELQLLGYQSLY